MSTNRLQFFKKHGIDKNASLSIPEISKLSGVPVSILDDVYRRGIGAHRTNITSVRLITDFSKNKNPAIPASARLSPQQWAMARVYSFVNKGKTFYTADADLAKKLK
jgi:hypothetical protein